MQFAARVPVSVGLVPWPTGSGATVVIKRTYDLSSRGVAEPSRVQHPLGLDRYDASGVLLHPSDFAPTKTSCDVALVGEVLRGDTGPVQLTVGELHRVVDRAAALAARPSPGALGDPTDPALERALTAAGFDYERFQWAPREQRLATPTLPLDVVIDVGPQRIAARIDGPSPEVALVDEAGWAGAHTVTVRLDGIALDWARRQIELVWRGLVEILPMSRAVLLVDATASLRTASLAEAVRWPRAEATEPAFLRRLLQRRPPQETLPIVAEVDLDATHAVVGLDDFGDDESTAGTITSKISVPPPVGASALPFAAPTAPSVPRPGPAPAPVPGTPGPAPGVDDERRATVAFEIPDELAGPAPGSSSGGLPFARGADEPGDEDDPLARTVARVASPAAAALPFVPAELTAPPRAANVVGRPATPPARVVVDAGEPDHDSLVTTAAVVPTGAAPLPPFLAVLGFARATAVPASPSAASPPPAASPSPPMATPPGPLAPAAPPGITAEQYGAIKAELWTSKDGRRATLRKHGLDEATWRLAERRFVQAVAGAPGAEDARAVVRRLRDEVSVRVVRRQP